MEPESEKLDDLAERIRQAGVKPDSQPAASGVGRIGFDFVGSIAGSCILGAIADHAFGTSPWCLVGMVFVGFAMGIMSAWRSMQKKE